MKKLRKLCCFMLSVVMMFSMSLTAFASSDSYNTLVLKDNATTKVVQTSDASYTYTATVDKIAGSLQLIQTNNSTGEVKVGDTVSFTSQTVMARASLEENTFTNYEYEITYGNPNIWELRRPGDNALTRVYFQTKQTTTNKEYLNAFKDAVDEINVKEGEIVGSLGMSALSVLAAGAAGAGAIFTGGTLSGAAWAAILSAAGFGTACVSVCMDYDQACKDAYDAYWNTYYNSTIL